MKYNRPISSDLKGFYSKIVLYDAIQTFHEKLMELHHNKFLEERCFKFII